MSLSLRLGANSDTTKEPILLLRLRFSEQKLSFLVIPFVTKRKENENTYPIHTAEKIDIV